MTPCNVVEIYSHFGEIYCLHLQGKRLLVYPEDSETVLLETWVDLHDFKLSPCSVCCMLSFG